MKVLTAAPYTYDGVEVGFCQCEPGELVMLGDTCECDCHLYDADGSFDDEDCGCRLDCDDHTPFSGLVSFAGTTTARVDEGDLTREQLAAVVRGSLERRGWVVPQLPDDVAAALVDEEVARILDASAPFPVGTLISVLNGRVFSVRELCDRAVELYRREAGSG